VREYISDCDKVIEGLKNLKPVEGCVEGEMVGKEDDAERLNGGGEEAISGGWLERSDISSIKVRNYALLPCTA